MTASSRTNWITQAIGLTSFTYLSQAFSILLLPVITRNFTPGDFGIYAVFISVLALVSVFASWRYYLAIALPEKDEDSKDIVWGSFALLTFMTIFLFLIIVQGRVLVPELIAHITEPRVRDLVSYLLPLGFFGVGISTLLSGWSMRIGKSIDLGVIRFIQVVATIAIQLTLKLNGTDGAYALVVGMVLGQLLSVVVHLVYIRTYSNGFFHLNAQGAWLQMKNYSYLPRTIVQTELFNAVGKKSLPLILAEGRA
jgi:O-antigen/teichoic acid export membrane protein